MSLETIIDAAWDAREGISTATTGEGRDAVEAALAALDAGELRVAEPDGEGGWRVNQWLKKAVLLSFRLNDNAIMPGPGGANWWDKVPSKFADWGENRFRDAGFRAVPGSVVRRGAFIGRNVVLMPSFVNIGAYVGANTMVDTWATVGSCAQIGANVHLSGGVGIGGVLEPLQANPSSSRMIASSVRAPKWSRASMSSAARCSRWGCSCRRPRKAPSAGTSRPC